MAAVKKLTVSGAEFLIRCGDVGSETILDHLAVIPGGVCMGQQ
jgi:hypothetical protein